MMRLAILGLDAGFGLGHTLDDFARAIYAGRALPVTDLPPVDQAEQAARVAAGALARARRLPGRRLAMIVCADRVEPWVSQVTAPLGEKWTMPLPPQAVPALGRALSKAQALLAEGGADLALLVATSPSGAQAVALARADAISVDDTYAVVEGCFASEAYSANSEALFSLADIDYLETATPLEESDLEGYPAQGAGLTCALSGGDSAPLASLIKVALCLHRRTLPPWPGWQGPQHLEHWQNTPFYVAPEARPWFARQEGVPRRAGLRLSDAAGIVHCLLAEPGPTRSVAPVCSQPGETTLHLVPLAASGKEKLQGRLTALQTQIRAGRPLAELAREAFDSYQHEAGMPFVLALVSHDLAELDREATFALDGVAKAFETGQPWTSPRGSYFTAQPLGSGGLAFVYPGAFNAYVGMGRDLFQHFPWLHERLAPTLPDIGQNLAEHLLYPRHLAPQGEADATTFAQALATDPAAMILTGIVFSMALTALLREVFNVQPQMAFGYSLGEVSMLWAGEVWVDAATGTTAWHKSPLFKTRLFGPKEAVLEAWGQAGLRSGGDGFWHTYLLKAPVEKVQAALASERRVYLTMINLPDEVVIAGEPAGCLRVINGLKGHVIRVPFDSVLHNPAMESEHDALARLYSYPVHANSPVTFYSAGRYAPLPLEREPLADILADMTCRQLDFPRLVNTAYANGARLFVEVGPQGTCTRWIERILRGRDFAALPLNRPRAGDYEGVVAVLAMLVSHGVPADLRPLYGLPAEEPGQAASGTPLALDHADHLSRQAALLAEGHQAFLQARHTAMRQTAELMQLQASLSEQMLAMAAGQAGARTAPRLAPLIDRAALRAFATGDPEACFGSAYAVYRGRRLPRLPNGDLLLVDRVVAADGTPGKVEAGASLTSEYDVPGDAWFLRQSSALPHVALMELALQPCGLLAAYLGSTLPYPDLDFYFRNLDGQAELLCDMDVRGQTIANRVRLLSSSALPGIILQKYEFELACGGEPIYRGTSSFGYFSLEALNNQPGLGDAETAPTPAPGGEWTAVDLPGAARSQLDFLEQAWVSTRGGRHSLGRIYAEAPVHPTDWYFKCHFYQDPVMPGSLGVEAVRQGLQILGSRLGAGPVRSRPLPGHPTTWKYRGQMTPEEGRLRLDAHATRVSASSEGLELLAEASVWKGACRVYEIKDLGVLLAGTPAKEG